MPTSLVLGWPAPPHNGGLRIVAYEISLARPLSPSQEAPPNSVADADGDKDLYDWQDHTKVLPRAHGLAHGAWCQDDT